VQITTRHSTSQTDISSSWALTLLDATSGFMTDATTSTWTRPCGTGTVSACLLAICVKNESGLRAGEGGVATIAHQGGVVWPPCCVCDMRLKAQQVTNTDWRLKADLLHLWQNVVAGIRPVDFHITPGNSRRMNCTS
jgi:hypothetical protein